MAIDIEKLSAVVIPQVDGTRFRLINFADLKVSTEGQYLIRGVIPRQGLCVVWGPPKCGKSFWVFDAAMHIALGRTYRERRVVTGTVVYVALEGERGLAARAEAFRKRKLGSHTGEIPFYLIATRLDLVADQQELSSDIAGQLGGVSPAVIVIDTLNRSLAGSESSDEDMGAYVKAADTIRELFNCVVIIIHHCGHDGTRPRGHTSLTGAADAQLAVKRHKDGDIHVTVEWMKDGEEGAVVSSLLEQVEVGVDEDNDVVTSCVIVESDETESALRRPKLSPTNQRAFDALQDAIVREGQPAPDGGAHTPPSAIGVSESKWFEYADKKGLSGSEKAQSKRRAFRRAATDLADKKYIAKWDDFIWIIR